MSDSEHSSVTYTSHYIPALRSTKSPDYVPGSEETEQAHFTPIYTFLVSEACLPEFFPVEDEEADPEEDPERGWMMEDPADYTRLTEETSGMLMSHMMMLMTRRGGGDFASYVHRTQASTPFPIEEVAGEIVCLTPTTYSHSSLSLLSPLPQIPSPPLPIPSQPPNSPTCVEGSLGSRAAGIRQRDALPSPIHETEMPEICLPLRKRPRRTTTVGPTTAEADLYGFADMLDAALGCQTSKELGYGITDIWDDLVGVIQEIAPTTLEGVNQRVTELVTTVDQEDEIIYSQLVDARYDYYSCAGDSGRGCLRSGTFWWAISLRTTVRLKSEITELQAAYKDAGTAKDPAEGPELQRRAVAVLDLGL
ncbi:hypothetical protein Tco_0576927 [Tanacetum coccineum]